MDSQCHRLRGDHITTAWPAGCVQRTQDVPMTPPQSIDSTAITFGSSLAILKGGSECSLFCLPLCSRKQSGPETERRIFCGLGRGESNRKVKSEYQNYPRSGLGDRYHTRIPVRPAVYPNPVAVEFPAYES